MVQQKVPVVLLAGWLFADLLLGLMVIFLAALPGKPPEAPILKVDQTVVTKNASDCTPVATSNTPICTISLTISESTASLGPLTWHASSDVSNEVVFTPKSTVLTPGKSQKVAISALPCQHGSIIFTGAGDKGLQIQPVAVAWHCDTPLKRLDFHRHRITLSVDYQGLLANNQGAINNVERQLRGQSVLQGQSVGFAIVYDGAPTDNNIGQADQVDAKIYAILDALGKQGFAFQQASFYSDNPLFILGPSPTQVVIDVYLFIETS